MIPRALLESLLRIPSPSGHEDEAVAFMQERAREDGFRVFEDPVGNFIAQAGRGPRLLLFVGHIDTVAGEIPVRVQDGALWGRGSVDAKGALVAAYCAARRFVGHDDVAIRIVGAIDEEGASKGARALPDEWRPEWIVVGEPSGAHGVTLGYKGIVRGDLVVKWEVAHGAGPQTGAADALLDAWFDVRTRFAFDPSFDAVQGRLDSVRTHGDAFTEQATGRFQLRLPPGTDAAAAQRLLRAVAADHGATLTLGEAVDAAVSSRRSALAAAFTSAIRSAGGTPRFLRKTGTADFNLLARQHPGVPLVAYGPGDSALDHRPHERLPLSQLAGSIQVLEHVFDRFVEMGDPARASVRTSHPRPG